VLLLSIYGVKLVGGSDQWEIWNLVWCIHKSVGRPLLVGRHARAAVLQTCECRDFSPALRVQPWQCLPFSSHNVHRGWVLEPQLHRHMIVTDVLILIGGLHILDAGEAANGLESILAVMEDTSSVSHSFQCCRETSRSLDGHGVRIGGAVFLVGAIIAVGVTIASSLDWRARSVVAKEVDIILLTCNVSNVGAADMLRAEPQWRLCVTSNFIRPVSTI